MQYNESQTEDLVKTLGCNRSGSGRAGSRKKSKQRSFKGKENVAAASVADEAKQKSKSNAPYNSSAASSISNNMQSQVIEHSLGTAKKLTSATATTRHRRQNSANISAKVKDKNEINCRPYSGSETAPRSMSSSSHGRHSKSTTCEGSYSNQRREVDDRPNSIAGGSEGRRTKHRRRAHSHRRRRSSASMINDDSSSSVASTNSSCNGSCSSDDSTSTSSGEPNLPYPGFPGSAFYFLTQDTLIRKWCLMLITNPWFERISILVILLNCITLGMYQPCVDDACEKYRCKILQKFDDIIFAFFVLEMTIKMIAMGMFGKNSYLADPWNRLDYVIVKAGLTEYIMHSENLNLTAIRMIRVLRPLRAINRIPSMRILVMLLLDTLPMLGNVLLLCFFVFFIFGIIGVQLWEGILRQRCMLQIPEHIIPPPHVSYYYEFSKEQDYICSKPGDSGMHLCSNLPPYRNGPMLCAEAALPFNENLPTNSSCVNWNQYYSECTPLGVNPFQGTISFDNIGMAWVAIFLVISLEGWTDIMYYVQDAHSFWDWIYFVLLIVIGSFFMINLCLVVIATQFSETKKREMERMRQERARYTSTSTLASSTNNSEPATCYAEIVKYIAHLWRRFKRRMLKKYRLYKYQHQQQKNGLLPNADNLTFSPSRIKAHHRKCPKYCNRKPFNTQDQMITVMVPLNSNNNTSDNNNKQNQLQQQQPTTTQEQVQQQQPQQWIPQPGTVTTQTAGTLVASTIASSDAQASVQNSSSENSEQSLERTMSVMRNSSLKKSTNQLKGDVGDQGKNRHNHQHQQQKTILLKFPQTIDSEQLILQLGNLGKRNPCNSGFLSPPSSASRRPSVMFNEYVLLHTPPSINETIPINKATPSSEKMTQAGDGSIWQVNLPQTVGTISNPYTDCSDLGIHDAMTCQELLAFSVAFSAALPTGQSTLESFYTSLTRSEPHTAADDAKKQLNTDTASMLPHQNYILEQNGSSVAGKSAVCASSNNNAPANYVEDYSCCYDLYQNVLSPIDEKKQRSKALSGIINVYRCVSRISSVIRRYIKRLVEHKYFQQGILLAILINTLSMGIEYHKQPEELTAIVETSNIVFSAIFAVEMLLKVVAEGPFCYIANGFNVFDGVIVILSAIEICQQFLGNGTGGGGSGLSVLRTFRLLRILKLVRFMPNLRRQLFVMLRTMDNVAVFFSLLVLFIFIFSILGMNLFGCKFCENVNGEKICDRKNFDSLLWALVTVFQILTQEDWNVVLFNGMEKTSHWAALYFVALMTFGNYVLFNLLVAILVEGFGSERNERREREQRELVKKLREETLAENYSDVMYDESRSEADSSSTNESYYEIRNRWHSAEDIRKLQDSAEHIIDKKTNMQKQKLLQQVQDQQFNGSIMSINYGGSIKKSSDKDVNKSLDEDKRSIKKTYSIKERRAEAPRLWHLRQQREPPIITTTAATPQDSPSTTLESGISFCNWNQQDLDAESKNQTSGSPSLLKPPTLLSGHRSLNEGIPSIDLIPPSPVLAHKQLNILNASQLGSSSNINNCNLVPISKSVLPNALSNSIRSVIIDDISKNFDASTSSPIFVPTISSGAASLQPPPPKHVATEDKNDKVYNPAVVTTRVNGVVYTATSSATTGSKDSVQNASNTKRFRRSSSKKKIFESSVNDEEQRQLNNGSENLCLLGSAARSESYLHPSATNIPAINKDTNRLSPQVSVRRLSTSLNVGSGLMSRRASACVFNSQLYQNLNQQPKLFATSTQRRMSSFELAFSKTSHLNLYNLESNRKSMSYTNSKLELDKWQKCYSNVNESDMLQQYIQERDKRKNSLSQSKQKRNQPVEYMKEQTHTISHVEQVSKLRIVFDRLKPKNFTAERESYSMYLFSDDTKFRQICTWFVNQKWFDNVVLLFIALNCITLAMERPNIPPDCIERVFLSTANYVFTVVFTVEMFVKVVATGMFYGPDAYFTSGWNIMDGSLVTISIIDLLMSLISESSPRIFGILRVFRLLRSLRPLRVINRAPGLKLVVQTLLSSLRPIGNIVLICCTFFIIFGILGVQLFKGTFYYCEGENIKNVRNMTDCLAIPGNAWTNRKYNFDDLGKALMSLFVLSSRDGWVNIMYTGLDAVGVDQQPIVNFNEWRLLYFIAFILLVGFFVLNMFVGVVVENFHRCREEQEKEEKIRRAAKRALQMEKKRRRMHEPPYYTNYSPTRMFVHNVVTSKYFDLAIAAVIGLNVVTMAMEYYKMPGPLQYALKIFNYFFTAVFILEANMKLVALGWHLYLKDKWNQLDVGIVLLSIVGIVLEELETNIIPINPTIIRVMRVLRIARVLKLLKMAKGIRALLDTVMQALPQVGNLGLLFFLLFFIFAALGVELFGRLECSDEIPCQGLGEHAHFANFGMAFLTLFRVATGDNWSGIMKDTLRDNCDDAADCVRNCCVSSVIAPIFFVIFVLMAQFVLVNVVVAVLMRHLEESHKQMEDEMGMEVELERELVREQEFEQEQKLCQQLQEQALAAPPQRRLGKVKSLPMNFTYSTPSLDKKFPSVVSGVGGRRQTIQYLNESNEMGLVEMGEQLTAQTLSQLVTEKSSIAAGVGENNIDYKLQVPLLSRRGRRSSTAFRKRGVLSKERSLDEQALRRRNLESKRVSCDSLPWSGDFGDYRSGTIFESMESDGCPSATFDVRSVRSECVPPKAADSTSFVRTTLVSEKPVLTAIKSVSKPETVRRPYGRSFSTDQSCNGPNRSTLLSVPRGMPTRSRSGSAKQLFKQQALEEDPDMDENSLLLPVENGNKPGSDKLRSHTNGCGNSAIEIGEGLSKSDSAEILRIISERRQIDHRDNSGNEDSDYNELLLVKSEQHPIG